MTNLTDLARRVSELQGPSREVDCLIAAATGWEIEGLSTPWAELVSKFGIEFAVEAATSHQSIYKLLPAYTASLDAAMTLARDDSEACEILSDAIDALGVAGWATGQWAKELPRFVTAAALIARSEA